MTNTREPLNTYSYQAILYSLRIPYLEGSVDYTGYIVYKPEVLVRLDAN